MSIKQILTTVVKGMLMGAADVVPGVSGGTIAFITGIYDTIIRSINAIIEIKNLKLLLKGKIFEYLSRINAVFLISLLSGILISIFSLAKFMKWALNFHPIPTWSFFFGLISASAILMLKDIKNFKIKDFLFLAGGVASGVVVCTLSPTETPSDLWFIFVCGAIAICAMILPGISGSFILLIMGKYEFIMTAIHEMDVKTLIIFVSGCAFGILSFAKFLHWLLSKYERQTIIILIGFIIGSLVKVWPWNTSNFLTPITDMQYGKAAIACLSGICAVIALEYVKNKFGKRV